MTFSLKALAGTPMDDAEALVEQLAKENIHNDPNWVDGGGGARDQDYWHSYSFGELTESAVTGRQVLDTIIPRLKIAGRCTLKDKFLVARGDLRTYRIRLGSGNILMEPNDQHLCIVPARHQLADRRELFVPWEKSPGNSLQLPGFSSCILFGALFTEA